MTDFADFARALAASRVDGWENLVVLARVGSTNALARRIAEECLEEYGALAPSLVVAYEQSAGRGRRGNRWASPPGRGVYATLVKPLDDAAAAPTLPLLAGVGLCRALDRHLGDPGCRLKWPNDLMVEGGKIGGLLIEVLLAGEGEAVALIGFGVNREEGEGQPASSATFLARFAPDPPPLGELTWDLVGAVGDELAHVGDVAYATAEYQRLSLHQPGDQLRCRLAGEVVEGTFLGFDPHGLLRLETGGRERRLAAGEVLAG